MQIPFMKMVGTGNDFIVVDARRRLASLARRWPVVSRTLCDRHTGIGADGLLVLEPSRRADVKMRVFNPDGSEAEMCGNGARCVAWLIRNKKVESRRSKIEDKKWHVTLETKAGRVKTRVDNSYVQTLMPNPRIIDVQRVLRLDGRSLSLCVLDTGVPHAVLFVKDLKAVDVQGLGRKIRYHRAFQPQGTNVDFVRPINDTTIAIRTYERGVESETRACGTGAVASAIAAVVLRQVQGLPVSRGPLFRPSKPQRMLLQKAIDELIRVILGKPFKDVRFGLIQEANELRAYRRKLVRVNTESGEALKVSFGVVIIPYRGKTEVKDVLLDGETRRVYQGVFPWPMKRSTSE